MQTTTKFIIAVALIVVFGLGVVVLLQQREIRTIQDQLMSAGLGGTNQNITNVTDSSKEIVGTVKSISGNSMIVDAAIVDLKSAQSLGQSNMYTPPTIKKTFSVAFDSHTTFSSVVSTASSSPLSAKDFKSGDSVRILSNESIQTTSQLTARSVEYIGGRKTPLGAIALATADGSNILIADQIATETPTMIRGTVTGVTGSQVSFKMVVARGKYQIGAARHVIIGQQTDIVERVLKPAAEISTITKKYSLEVQAHPGTYIPFPITYNSERKISVADLKIGDSITVFAADTSKEPIVAGIVARVITP